MCIVNLEIVIILKNANALLIFSCFTENIPMLRISGYGTHVETFPKQYQSKTDPPHKIPLTALSCNYIQSPGVNQNMIGIAYSIEDRLELRIRLKTDL